MSNSQGGPGNSLGLAVGATNLACTGDGQRTLVQPATVTLRPDLTLTGFVDRVGDPVPIIAGDGTRHRPEMLLAEALDRLARSAAISPVSEVAVAVPAHWRPLMVDALREALGRKAGLAKTPLVTDATAALTALRSNPGLPSTGVIAVCDFGGSGSSITLVDAAADAPIGDTVRVPDFSGDLIDQAVLSRVVAGLLDASHADPAGTAMVGSLSRLRDECRRAKERLSDETATGIVVDVPGLETTVRMTRMELDSLITEPLSEFMTALGDTLDRNRVPLASVSAVATVGGGARIPLVTQRLSEYLRVGVVTTPRPQLTVAEGVALIAHRGQIVETATAMAPAAPATATVAAAAFAGAASPAVGALAWSEVDDDDNAMAVAPPLEHDHYAASPVESRPELHFEQDAWDQQTPSRRRSPVLLFGLAAVAVAVAAVVFGLTAFTRDTPTVPAGSTAGIAPAAPPSAADSAPAVQQAQAQVQPSAPSQDPAVTTVMARPAPQAVAQQPAAPAPEVPAPAAAPAPEAPAPEAPAPEAPAPAPAPEAPAPAPAPANPAPASPWTPPWTPPWKLPTHNGPGTPPADSGTGTNTGGTGTNTGGTGSNAGTGTGSGTGTQTGTDTGTSTGSGGSAKGPAAPGLIPVLQPGN